VGNQLRDGRLDHLIVEKFATIILSADGEVADGARQQITLKPFSERIERVDDAVVRRLEFALSSRVHTTTARALNHLWDDAREVINTAAHLRDGRLGIDARRISKIGARFTEQPRNLMLARQHSVEALLDGRIISLEDIVNAGRRDVVINVRVALPRAYLFKLKQPPARVRREHQIIVARVFSERCGVETREQ